MPPFRSSFIVDEDGQQSQLLFCVRATCWVIDIRAHPLSVVIGVGSLHQSDKGRI